MSFFVQKLPADFFATIGIEHFMLYMAAWSFYQRRSEANPL